MTQSQLNQAVAAATGETLREIRRRGFSQTDLREHDFDPEPNDLQPQTVDWDSLAQQRYASFAAA